MGAVEFRLCRPVCIDSFAPVVAPLKETAMSLDLDPDIKGMLPERQIDRRDFMWSALGASAALALANSASGQQVVTDSVGVAAADVMIPAKDGQLRGYRAMPDKDGPFPIVLVAAEVFGLNPYMKDVCRRLAKAGYYAIVPDLYTRTADLTKVSSMAEIMPVVNAKRDTELVSDYDATVEFARASGKADVARMGITGFCRGGRTTLVYAAANPKLKAAVAWYGSPGGQPSDAMPRTPMDRVSEIKVPLLGLRRQGRRHSRRAGREVLRRAEGRRNAGGIRRLSGRWARLPRRLPPRQLPEGGCRRRLEAHAGMVQEVRRGVAEATSSDGRLRGRPSRFRRSRGRC
jgi:carboxymethylenebutenolidase